MAHGSDMRLRFCAPPNAPPCTHSPIPPFPPSPNAPPCTNQSLPPPINRRRAASSRGRNTCGQAPFMIGSRVILFRCRRTRHARAMCPSGPEAWTPGSVIIHCCAEPCHRPRSHSLHLASVRMLCMIPPCPDTVEHGRVGSAQRAWIGLVILVRQPHRPPEPAPAPRPAGTTATHGETAAPAQVITGDKRRCSPQLRAPRCSSFASTVCAARPTSNARRSRCRCAARPNRACTKLKRHRAPVACGAWRTRSCGAATSAVSHRIAARNPRDGKGATVERGGDPWARSWFVQRADVAGAGSSYIWAYSIPDPREVLSSTCGSICVSTLSVALALGLCHSDTRVALMPSTWTTSLCGITKESAPANHPQLAVSSSAGAKSNSLRKQPQASPAVMLS
ncbi:hypothetical protein MRB53_038053 [Persea americana]|nr:hypothetical protein MRB53_038053 [Persea americana]